MIKSLYENADLENRCLRIAMKYIVTQLQMLKRFLIDKSITDMAGIRHHDFNGNVSNETLWIKSILFT